MKQNNHTYRFFLTIVLGSIIFSSIAIFSDEKQVKFERKVVGKIWKVYQAENLVFARMEKPLDLWLEKRIFIENFSSEIIAEFKFNYGQAVTLYDKIQEDSSGSENGKEKSGEPLLLLPGKALALDWAQGEGRLDKKISLKMGYNLVIEHKKFAWLDQPKRRENPFLTQELVKPYPKKIINHIDAREMSFIERGEFIMGSSAHLANEHPQRIVFLDEYYMDRFEVSNSQFHAYLKASQQLVRNIWPRGTPLEAEKDLAFGRASYYMAEAYCKWAGKDLPTEEQWEKAARGPGIKKEKDDLGRFVYYKEPFYYPWGNQYIPKNCNGEGRLNFILSVDSLPEGQSPYGIYHLMGNVMEWTKSWYRAYPQSSSRDRDFGEVFKVLRGGDYMSPRSDLRVSRRMPGGIPSLSEDRRAGIRCVYNLKTPAQDGP